MRDCFKNWSKWKRVFAKHKGLLILLIGLKFPIARQYFYDHFRTNRARTVQERVFKALVATAREFEKPEIYEKLRIEIDDIKGPLKVHGLSVYLRRIGVAKPLQRGIRLGAGEQRFGIVKFSTKSKASIDSFLNLS